MKEIIYLDSEFKCHRVGDETMITVETDFFTGKCNTFVEGYRFVPAGHEWVRSDGTVFKGEMISPWKPYSELAQVQAIFDEINNSSTQEDTDALLVDHEYRLTLLELDVV